jgi:hypothetical protein
MRRAELLEASRNVLNALTASKVRAALLSMITQRHQGKENLAWGPILSAMTNYAVMASRFGANERQVITLLGLTILEGPILWQPESREDKKETLVQVYNAVRYTEEYLVRFLDLIKQSADDAPGQDTRLRVILIEEEGNASTPERLIKVFEGVKELYEVCATLRDEPHHSLIVAACDSGSDKSFDFLGIAKVVQALKELIVSMWDRIAFFPEQKAEARLGLLAKSLPVLEEIHHLRETGALDAGQAEQLKRKAVSGVVKFVEAGVTTPEINARTIFNPRQILAPDVKQLTAGSPKDATAKPTRQLPKALVPDAEILEEHPQAPSQKSAPQEEYVEDDEAELDAGPPSTDEVELKGLTKEEEAQLAALHAKVRAAETSAPAKPKTSSKKGSKAKPAASSKRTRKLADDV